MIFYIAFLLLKYQEKEMAAKKSYFAAVLAVILVFCTVATVLAFVPSGSAVAADRFVKTDELKIAHITDTHYYPLNYGYNEGNGNTEYGKQLIAGTKLLAESSFITKQALSQLLDEMPDYLFVSGDLTINGEIQGHIELANLLRDIQNKVRQNGKENFQVFVSVGNHDLYNKGAVHFRDGGVEKECTHLTTRYDITRIYSSLGYPDLSDSEIEAYYTSLVNSGAEVYFDNLPYEGRFVNSVTASNITIERQYEENNVTADYDNGDLTHIAYLANNFVLINIDSPLSDPVINHHTGGYFYESTRNYIAAKAEEGKFGGKTLFAMMHHNLVPHFPLEDSLLKDFTVYGWREAADFLADIGVRYAFTGHMHSNDIAKHQSLNNNIIIDTETSSLTGYKGGMRYVIIERGSIGNTYAENYKSRMELVEKVDITDLFTKNFITESYLEFCNLTQYIEHTGNKYYIKDASEYSVTKLFRNIVNNVKYTYLNPEFILGLSDMVTGMFNSDNFIVSSILGIAGPLIDNLIVHIEDVVLADYTYKGSNPAYQGEGRGKKLCGYVDEMVDTVLYYAVNGRGDTFFDFGMGGYLAHQGGIDTALADADPYILEALEGLKNGDIVKFLFDTLLSDKIGLMRIVKGLLKPINLTYGLSTKDAAAVEAVLNLLTPAGQKIDGSAVLLDTIAPGVITLLGAFIDIPFELEGTLEETLDHIIEGYITDSFYTGLGEIAYNIMSQFYIDETAKYEISFGDYVTYKFDPSAPATYTADMKPEDPTIESGKLPSMLTVTFGADPATTKNFVWFTDRRVTGTEIQYMEGEFNAAAATQKSGSFASYATTTASIDLGIFATLMHVPVGRHSVELTGLKPGTTYSYRVGSAADSYWSPVYTFRTAPAEESAPFEILLISDIQGSALRTYELSNKIMGKMGEVFPKGYDFVLNSGDVVDNSKNLVQWKYLLDTLQGYWGNTTQVVAAGNHDKSSYKAPDAKKPSYSQIDPNAIQSAYNYLALHYNISYPEQDDLTGFYYSFDYSGVHFTVLNTNSLDRRNRLSTNQLNWLINDLQSTDKVKVVIMHKSIYSSGSHVNEKDVVALREQLTPIFYDYGVKLVLGGHDHTYCETYYLDGAGNPVKSFAKDKGKIDGDGVLYVTLGTFGDKFYKYVESDLPIEFGQKLHNPTLKNPTFGKLVFDGSDLYYFGYEYDIEKDKVRLIRSDSLKAIIGLSVVGAVVISSIVAVSVTAAKAAKRKKTAA